MILNQEKIKLIARTTVFVLIVLMVMIPAQTSYAAGCVESATKAVVAVGIAGVGLMALDCMFFGCFFTASTLVAAGAGTVGAGTAAGLVAVKGAALAGTTGCLNGWMDDSSSRPKP